MPYSDFDTSIIEAVDPTLTYRSNLYPEATTCFTLLVEQEGTPYVLKVRRKTHNMWDERYFHYEIAALQRAADRELKRVTRLLRVYDDERYQAILKEYAVGTPGNRQEPEDLLLNPDFVAKLDRIYLDLHLAGIAKICFEPRKVVIGDDGEVTFVDLSSCVVDTEVGMLLFSQAMRADSRHLTEMEKEISRKARGVTGRFGSIFNRG